MFDKSQPSRDDFLEGVVRQFVLRRKALNLSQEDVDQKMGNADRLCSKWECGMRTPTSFNLMCWAEVLNCMLVLSPLEKDTNKQT